MDRFPSCAQAPPLEPDPAPDEALSARIKERLLQQLPDLQQAGIIESSLGWFRVVVDGPFETTIEANPPTAAEAIAQAEAVFAGVPEEPACRLCGAAMGRHAHLGGDEACVLW